MRNESFPRAKAIKDPLETATISFELEKIGRCRDVFSKQTTDACKQAAYLLRRMRLIGYSEVPDSQIAEAIKEMLVKQGDG